MTRHQTQIYIVGGGIAGLSAAVFATRDGGVEGRNIHLFEELKVLGGALDAGSDRNKWYSMRGARLINEKAYQCYFDMLSTIPCLAEQEEMEKGKSDVEHARNHRPLRSVKDEIFEFNCVFRMIVTGRSGNVTADFGIVTDRSGIVTEGGLEGFEGCV